MRLENKQVARLEEYAYQIRRLSLEMITCGHWGHPGGSLSLAEILAVLYFHVLRVDPQNPAWEERDRLILSGPFFSGFICFSRT
jgi:transketolase